MMQRNSIIHCISESLVQVNSQVFMLLNVEDVLRISQPGERCCSVGEWHSTTTMLTLLTTINQVTVINITWPKIEALPHHHASCKQLHFKRNNRIWKKKKKRMSFFLPLAFTQIPMLARSGSCRLWDTRLSLTWHLDICLFKPWNLLQSSFNTGIEIKVCDMYGCTKPSLTDFTCK